MSEWKKVKLGEILTEINERNKGEKVQRVLSVTNSQGFVNQEEYFEGTVHSTNISNYKIVRKNQFAYNPSRVNVGSIDILKDYDEGALSPMYVVFKVDTNKLLPEYFKYYFQTNRFYENVKNNTQGSVRNSLSFKALSGFEYLLPPIEEQGKIVKILENVDNIIDRYEKLLKEKEQFIKSQFVEMFGDPNINNKRWQIGTIRELVKNVKYGTSKPSSENGKYKYLRMNNITYDGNLDTSDIKYIDIPEIELKKCVATKGDILFNRTNSRELVGKTCVYKLDEPMIIAGFIIRMQTNEFANPYFISEYLNTKYMKKNLMNMCKNACGQANINAQEMQNIKIFIPPIELQNKFAEFVQVIDKQKIKLEKQISNYKDLKKGLMQQLLTGKVKI